MSSFFGLREEDKPAIHDQIFSLCFHGKGGFNFTEVYNMPTYLRHFYIKKAQQYYDKEKEQYEKANKKSSSGISRPGITRGR
jgi:hypothetical protein